MKKLLLTSAALGNPKISEEFIKLLGQDTKNVKVLMVSYSQNDEEQYYINESEKELINLGFVEIRNLNMNENFDLEKLGDFDVVYICGGNTFLILDKLKKTGLFEFTKRQIENGSVFVGVSAGSIIAGKDIEIAGWGSEGDDNEIDLQDLVGFSFTDIAVFPHFKEELRGEVEEFRSKVDYPVLELFDNQALLIINGEEKVIE